MAEELDGAGIPPILSTWLTTRHEALHYEGAKTSLMQRSPQCFGSENIVRDDRFYRLSQLHSFLLTMGPTT